jgi:hypothetical protein
MGALQRLKTGFMRVFDDEVSHPPALPVPQMSRATPLARAPDSASLPVPQLLSARGTELCQRCGRRSTPQQLIYSHRGMYFGGECIGRVLIIEREKPRLADEELRTELSRDMTRFRALGLARTAERMLRENS